MQSDAIMSADIKTGLVMSDYWLLNKKREKKRTGLHITIE